MMGFERIKFKTPMNTPLEERVERWIHLSASWNIDRVLLHPNDAPEAKKLWPLGNIMGLPIEFLGEAE